MMKNDDDDYEDVWVDDDRDKTVPGSVHDNAARVSWLFTRNFRKPIDIRTCEALLGWRNVCYMR